MNINQLFMTSMSLLDVTTVAPAASFIAIALLGTGLYRTANRGGLLVRRKIATYAPVAGVPLGDWRV